MTLVDDIRFDDKSGIRERLALLAAVGPGSCDSWTYNPSSDSFHRPHRMIKVSQEGSASLDIIATRWHMTRRNAMRLIGYPEQ